MSKIALLLTQGFADWEYALIGGTAGPFYGIEVQYFTPVAGQVRSQGGLGAQVSENLDNLQDWQPDALVVVGGMIWTTDQSPDIRNLLNQQHSSGTVVAGICGGTLALARAGLLNEGPHTSNDPDYLTQNARDYAGTEHYLKSPSAVSANRIITAPGTAPVSFAAAVYDSIGMDQSTIAQFKAMMAAEFGSDLNAT
ncbi:DJ-1/PfpI family protein [Maritalea porphyrae]|uniref:DJ-1/PfpI family protein n=1 Tax=Maritalea porphyrae TaxID=880732 RepID=UPI0022AF192F|nr:DJ-1/PfpI family protein [Maritalea porphyrae]MCZ4270984.1 DJ-1/PfpI family protein [Maritalea porphyrae]